MCIILNDFVFRYAVINGDVKMVKASLIAGADVHADNDGSLRDAAKSGNVAVVKLLLAAGANIYAMNNFALRWAASKGHTEVVKVLLDHSLIHAPYTSRVIQEVLNFNLNSDIRELLQNYVTQH
jgi:ankyrin repeat protein